MSFSWEKNVRTVEPYVPGEQPKVKDIIKLNTNENPYPPSDKVIKLIDELDPDMFRRYPDARIEELATAIADYHNVPFEKVFVGVGSDDVLGMAFMTFFNSDKNVLFPDITYSFYPVWCEMLRIPYETLPLDDDFRIKKQDYMKENGGIVIANPNAPTGILMEKSELEEIIASNPDSVVIVDEAYIDFAPEGSSCTDLIDKYDNLLVVRTFSKSRSLAGLRIGYALGNAKLISFMNDVKYSYNSYTMNYPSIKLGAASIGDNDYFVSTIEKIKATRERFTAELQKLGFTVLPSSTNFVFASPSKATAEEIFKATREENIIVRYFKQPRIDNFLRITIGTDEEMDILLDFLRKNY